MDRGNGREAVHFWMESTDFEDSGSFSNDESIENLCFRGFEKQPKVLLEKIDIEPYLERYWKIKKLRENLPKLVSDCFVKLAREDLQLLQREIRENSRRNHVKTKGILSMPALRCKVCEKTYNSEKKLQNHLENKHLLVYKAELARKTQKRVSFCENVVIHELREYNKCRKCSKIFNKYQSLKAHMKQRHRKRKCYICHYCSKDFVDRMFFKVHIKHHCDICGMLLPNKRMYLRHKQESCRVSKTYACKTCKERFLSYMGLKDHSYDHMEGIHVCDICHAQYKSKCAVAIHIMFLHSSKPKELFGSRNIGTERLYVCNFCAVSSLDRSVIYRHVSMLPDADNFSCDQCLRQFDSESNMLQHKWSHFLNTPSQVQPEAVENLVNDKMPILKEVRIVLDRLDLDKLHRFYDNNNLNSEDKDENQIDATKSVNKKKTIESNLKVVIDGLIDANYKEAGLTVRTDIESQEVSSVEEIPLSSHNEVSVIVKKAIVDPKSKKTLISKFQCEKCNKYYSTNYCLTRHKAQVHENGSLQCHLCEQSFQWPSLLKTHKCKAEIPLNNRSDFQYDNYREFGSDELMNISENEDYMNAVDFDIPAPIVQLSEYNNRIINDSCVNNYGIPVNTSYKIVMQEVPIEF